VIERSRVFAAIAPLAAVADYPDASNGCYGEDRPAGLGRMQTLHGALAAWSHHCFSLTDGYIACRLPVRSTGRAGTRLLVGGRRRGPPVRLLRWADWRRDIGREFIG